LVSRPAPGSARFLFTANLPSLSASILPVGSKLNPCRGGGALLTNHIRLGFLKESIWDLAWVRSYVRWTGQYVSQGLPTAQLALAHIYSARRSGPKDLVYAYMWFLIVNEQITRVKNHVNKTMTMEQLLEAEQRAAE
jgi:hypothetical protein